jgi:hypothetical protein
MKVQKGRPGQAFKRELAIVRRAPVIGKAERRVLNGIVKVLKTTTPKGEGSR